MSHSIYFREELRKKKLVRMNSIVDLPYPTRLDWNLSADIQTSISKARHRMDL